jgi:magnesium-transporting ATPase (P-type)
MRVGALKHATAVVVEGMHYWCILQKTVRSFHPLIVTFVSIVFQALCHKGSGKIDPDALAAAIPRLRVLAKCTPTEKFRLVRSMIYLEEQCCGRGDIVAVTGDSVQDAPALKIADVGFALSTGTDVAKEASDMILLDDSLCTILKAVAWGRAVYDNVSKFLQFQMTVNIVALVVIVITVIFANWSPFTPMQILWINLIMDAFAAVALASDSPTSRIMKRCPYKR